MGYKDRSAEDNKRHWPALHGFPSPLNTNTWESQPSNGAKAPLEGFSGSKISCIENGVGRQLKAGGPILGHTGPFVVLTAFQTTLASPSTGSEINCDKNQACDFWASHTVEYDSLLNQQSICGKITSFILCVWKQGFFQIQSHIAMALLHEEELSIILKINTTKIIRWKEQQKCRGQTLFRT